MYDDATPATESERNEQYVTVLGTGNMGSAVARRLLEAGLPVGVWNRSPQSAIDLAGLGATAYGEPAEAVAVSKVVVTLLPTADAVGELMDGRGVLDAMGTGSVWAQMGTIGVEATEHLRRLVGDRRPDVHFVDSPVSGSRRPAESGDLLVLASGPGEAAEALRPVFDAIGRRTLWLGPAGAGSRMKLVLNTWLAFEVEAAAEAATLAERFGIPRQSLADAIDHNPLASTLATTKLQKMESADNRADFSLEWALKDLDLMRQATHPGDAPIAVAIAERWRTLVEAGFGELDVSAARYGLGERPVIDSKTFSETTTRRWERPWARGMSHEAR